MIADHKTSDGQVYRVEVKDGKRRYLVGDGRADWSKIAASKVPPRVKAILGMNLDESRA